MEQLENTENPTNMPNKTKPSKRSEGMYTATFNSLATKNIKSQRGPPSWFDLTTRPRSLEESSSLCRPGISYSQALMGEDSSSCGLNAESVKFDNRRGERASNFSHDVSDKHSYETLEYYKRSPGSQELKPTSSDESLQTSSNSSWLSPSNVTLTSNDTATCSSSLTSTTNPSRTSTTPSTSPIPPAEMNNEESKGHNRRLSTYAEFVAKNYGLLDNVTEHRNEPFDVEDVSTRLGIGQWNFTDLDSVMAGYPRQLNQFDDPHYTNLEKLVMGNYLNREKR